MITPVYKLKNPCIYDVYEQEYPVKMSPAYRAIFKASGKFYDGYIRKDLRVKDYVKQAKDNGQDYGLYHFFLPNDVSRQIDLFLNTATSLGKGQMPLTLDVECDPAKYGVGRIQWAYQVKTALDLIEKETKVIPIIYTSVYYWTYVTVVGWTPSYYPLWTAQYPRPATYVDSVSAPYPLPKGWSKWAMWQYAEDGRTQGYFANDFNVPSDWFAKYLNETDWGGGTHFPSRLIFEPVTIGFESKGVSDTVTFENTGG